MTKAEVDEKLATGPKQVRLRLGRQGTRDGTLSLFRGASYRFDSADGRIEMVFRFESIESLEWR